MWINVIFLVALAVQGNTYYLEDANGLPRSLDKLLAEIEREARYPAHKVCEGKQDDIAFIVDASRSIYPPDFYKATQFLGKFVETLDIGPDDVRIACVTYGDKVITDSAFRFNQKKTKTDVLDALKSLKIKPELGDTTNTAMAIAYAREQFFVKARPTAEKIAIVLTDGKSRDFGKTKAEAELLKRQGVHIIAIGVGNKTNETELNAIATDSYSVLTVDSYGALIGIISTLGRTICKTTTTAAPTTIRKVEPCDGQAIDFNFVFDSAQMGTSGSESAIGFIKNVVTDADLNNGKVRVGTITGPCPDTQGFRLNRYSQLWEIKAHFDEYTKTDMASLITDLRMEAFKPRNGGRKNARKVGVLFLKGKLSDPAKAKLEANLAKKKGIEIFIVDMGSLNHERLLESMASGKGSHILRASDAAEMIYVAREFVDQICKKNPGPDCRSADKTKTDDHRLKIPLSISNL